MQPLDLYLRHEKQAEEVAVKLCYHYQFSGALPFKDDAIGEAKKALWKCAVTFDPAKQVMACRKEAQQAAEVLAAIIFGYLPPEYEERDPYANFWMASIMRVRGSVQDLFRSQKLIRKFVAKGTLKKLSKQDIKDIQQRMFNCEDEESIAAAYAIEVGQLEELKPSMLYYEKFVSLSRPISDYADGSYAVAGFAAVGESLGDMLPSKESTDSCEGRIANRSMIEHLKKSSQLTVEEARAVELTYSDEEPTAAEVAKKMGTTVKRIDVFIASAIEKMKCSAQTMATAG